MLKNSLLKIEPKLGHGCSKSRLWVVIAIIITIKVRMCALSQPTWISNPIPSMPLIAPQGNIHPKMVDQLDICSLHLFLCSQSGASQPSSWVQQEQHSKTLLGLLQRSFQQCRGWSKSAYPISELNHFCFVGFCARSTGYDTFWVSNNGGGNTDLFICSHMMNHKHAMMYFRMNIGLKEIQKSR